MNNILEQNKRSWDAMADTWFGTTALPTYGCFIPTEDELHLFPDLSGKRVLDIGCGSGHSLCWCGEQGAAELWGLDLSARQVENARKHLVKCGYSSNLYNGPMEVDPGLPKTYFDVVYSIYAIGWSTDLKTTFHNIASYLKPGGAFLFSWDHPLMHCVEAVGEQLAFTGSYVDESFSYIQRGQPVTVQNRRLSTYINELADTGFAVEKIIEETDSDTLAKPAAFSAKYYSAWKANKLPLSFIVKATKL
ncbi:class I SAM-dependent methyltransferase [Fumia xinanensis]|uniref:Class I SAM-dependent methyltransferase n=1 Tax=Fumia xinanensis TaxID=2763659 RepID=A0A926E847_9FIRM|nr:class I SAM-dependent methyltransferase [Fumia xinanensis]MBC8560906.1 class I SAM-dependent methyltransferase [Fumia xinanensis]